MAVVLAAAIVLVAVLEVFLPCGLELSPHGFGCRKKLSSAVVPAGILK